MHRQILMIGSAPGTRGGVSAMVEVCAAHGLFRRWHARYLPTHRDGTKLTKAMVALRAWCVFMARLLTGGVALLHVHLASDASFWRKSLFVVPAHLLGVPYVLHMHGGNFIEFYRSARFDAARRFIRWMYRRARVVIALSEEWRDAIAGMEPQSRIVVIPNPVVVPAQEASLDVEPPTVLFLGIVRETKGVLDLLRAWPSVRAAVPDARLVLAGSGDLALARTIARELGIDDSLRTPGWILGEAKADLLREAWIFTLPSHIEALPMSVLEAMAAGLPVVATAVGGIPTAIEHGRSGILIAPQDVGALSAALRELLTDAGRRKAMGRAARSRAIASFSADFIVPRIEALWRGNAPRQEARGVARMD